MKDPTLLSCYLSACLSSAHNRILSTLLAHLSNQTDHTGSRSAASS